MLKLDSEEDGDRLFESSTAHFHREDIVPDLDWELLEVGAAPPDFDVVRWSLELESRE